MGEYIEAIKHLLDYIEGYSASAWITLSALAIGTVCLISIYKTKKNIKPRNMYVIGVTISLLLIIAAQGFRVWYVNTLPITTPQQSFEALKNNKRVDWVIRLIPYSRQTESFLSIFELKKLGLKNQKYVFVADYDELKNLTVREAVYRIGASLSNKDAVSVIIFPRCNKDLIPANARGILQVTKEIDTENSGKDGYRLFNISETLDSESQNQLQDRRLRSWSWDEYSRHYQSFRNAVEVARRNGASAFQRIGTLGPDWHPAGYSQVLDAKSTSYMRNAFQLRTEDKAEINLPNFGCRAFLIENLTIKDIKDVVLIQFSNLDQARIPDFGGRNGGPPPF